MTAEAIAKALGGRKTGSRWTARCPAHDDSQKMMFGSCRCGAVRLADPSDVLMIGEDLETCLAAIQATAHPAWAAL